MEKQKGKNSGKSKRYFEQRQQVRAGLWTKEPGGTMNKKWKAQRWKWSRFSRIGRKSDSVYSGVKQVPWLMNKNSWWRLQSLEIAGGDQEEIKLIWQRVDQEQTDLLMGYQSKGRIDGSLEGLNGLFL